MTFLFTPLGKLVLIKIKHAKFGQHCGVGGVGGGGRRGEYFGHGFVTFLFTPLGKLVLIKIKHAKFGQLCGVGGGGREGGNISGKKRTYQVTWSCDFSLHST